MNASSVQSGTSAEILLVEDNPGDVRLTEEALAEGGIEVDLHVVSDGIKAMDFLYQRESYTDVPRPDLVLLDLNLPRKNGDEVLAEIRDDQALSPLPVIVLTSSTAEEDIVKSYDLEANAYLQKPIDPSDFIETIQAFEEFWLQAVRLPPDN